MDKTLFSLRAYAVALCTGAAALLPPSACAQALPEPMAQAVHALVGAKVTATPGQRVEIALGQIDPRMRLRPCQRIEPFIPRGARMWGKTRMGLRCVEGVTPWTVYVPVTVTVYAQAWVARAALPAGHVLSAEDLRQAEVNFTESANDLPLTDAQSLIGRTLSRPVGPGQSLRAHSLRTRQWFAAGDTVQIRVGGPGFSIHSAGKAVTAGLEGQLARVRAENGRIIQGMPVADRELEIAL